VSLRLSAKTIDRAALAALATLVISYALIVGDASSPSASWVWLGVAVILLVANAARLSVGARPSERGVAVGVAALALALLRLIGVVAEVTLPAAALTVGASLLLPSVMRFLSWMSHRL